MYARDEANRPKRVIFCGCQNGEWRAREELRHFPSSNAARIQDTAYFGAIIHQMENGGLEALMHHLLSVDLEGVNLRKIPQTDALADQKLRSLDSVATWLYGCLDNGGIEETETSSSTYFHDWPETLKPYACTMPTLDTVNVLGKAIQSGHSLW